jgi:autophagy-related protein 2
VSLKIIDGSVKVLASTHPGALLLHIGDLDFSTNLIGDSPELDFMLSIHSAAFLAIDDLAEFHPTSTPAEGFLFWKKRGFVLLAEITDLALNFKALKSAKTPDTRVMIQQLGLRLHLCADTMSAISAFISDLVVLFNPPPEHQSPKRKRKPMVISEQQQNPGGIMSSVGDLAFKKVPEIGPAPDMIFDDLPRNLDYLDESFGAAGGLRELRDEDLDEFNDDEEVFPISSGDDDFDGVVSRVGGETIRMLRPEGLQIIDNHFDNLPPITENSPTE